ncbi:hypothetical protein GALL_382790 [mine drainage metagenome]|uniref:Uncharacterized protein n=1 Tax=mine drainage metagenome TaxID=410659 RepID=A0A1J5QR60_9ZZZZ
MLAVGLREHQQLDVGRVAPELAEGVDQVIDLVARQRQALLDVGALQRGAAFADHVDALQRARLEHVEQTARIVARADHGFGHAVVQQRRQTRQRRVVKPRRRAQQTGGALRESVFDPAFDAQHVGAAAVRDVGGLARPRRNRPQPWQHQQRGAVGGAFVVGPVAQQRGEPRLQGCVGGFARRDEMQQPGVHADDVQLGRERLDALQQRLATERRQRAGAFESGDVHRDAGAGAWTEGGGQRASRHSRSARRRRVARSAGAHAVR